MHTGFNLHFVYTSYYYRYPPPESRHLVSSGKWRVPTAVSTRTRVRKPLATGHFLFSSASEALAYRASSSPGCW
jgi:hypothetical protein